MQIFTLVSQAGWQHTKDVMEMWGPLQCSAHGIGCQAQHFSRLEFTVKSPLVEPHTPSQADLGRSVLSCMDVGQNAAFFQQRGSGALDL